VELFLDMVDYNVDDYYLLYWIKDGQSQYIVVNKNEIEY
jgi:hypothetical protein